MNEETEISSQEKFNKETCCIAFLCYFSRYCCSCFFFGLFLLLLFVFEKAQQLIKGLSHYFNSKLSKWFRIQESIQLNWSQRCHLSCYFWHFYHTYTVHEMFMGKKEMESLSGGSELQRTFNKRSFFLLCFFVFVVVAFFLCFFFVFLIVIFDAICCFFSGYYGAGLDLFILFLIFKFKFKFTDFEKTKFKFTDLKKLNSNSNLLTQKKLNLNSNALTLKKLNSNSNSLLTSRKLISNVFLL